MSTAIGKPLLTFALAFVAGAIGAALGWLAVAWAADILLESMGMSNMEGGRSVFALMGLGPLGGIVGLVLGVWLVLRFYAGDAGAAGVVGYSAAVALLSACIGAAYAGFLYLSDDVLVRNGPTPQAKFELRFPANARLPDALEGVRIDLNTDKNTAEAYFGASAPDGSRPVISGSVDLYYRTKSRLLVLRVPGEPDRVFLLKLAANPPASPGLGSWQLVDFVADQPDGKFRKGEPRDDYAIRYGVERQD